MATDYPTLADQANRCDPDGSIAVIVESLAQTNEVLKDMVWIEGNLPTGHKTTRRLANPTVTWRQLNSGVSPDHSTTEQVTDTCGILAAYSDVDRHIAQLNGNTPKWRASEAKAQLEAMSQEFAYTLFYGDTSTDPEEFHGLTPRYDTLSSTSPVVISGAGDTASVETSMWLICWGEETVCGIFPKGSKAGLTHTDLGEVTIGTAALGYFQGYRDYFEWQCGLSVRDPRYIIRIANLDTTAGTMHKDAADEGDLVDLMIQAIHALPNPSVPNKVFYASSYVLSMLDRQAVSSTQMRSTMNVGNSPFGETVVTFRGIPIRRVDQILLTEAVVAA